MRALGFTKAAAAVVVLAAMLLVPTYPSMGQVGGEALRSCRDFAFSTEEDFVTQGPEPPDGNPIISDGDLLGRDHAICARNQDLVQRFEVAVDLGLDAVHVVEVETYLVAFSTELDSPNVGQFAAGDLLATNGVIIPNIALTSPFGVGYDVGLDGVLFVGNPEGIRRFLDWARDFPRDFWLQNPGALAEMLSQYEIDLWFSTEGTSPTPMSPGFLDGDLLSAATGTIVASNGNLLPISVPAGIPTRGVDFGLDSVAVDPAGTVRSLHFSTEILFEGNPTFTDGDLLLYGNGVVRANWDLIAPFEPMAEFLGLDAVFILLSSPETTSLIWQVTSAGNGFLSDSLGSNLSADMLSVDAGQPTSLGLRLEACEKIAFSTEEDFVTQGPVPPDGNPIISDGDLLGPDHAICARNQDLVGDFDVTEDLGLDAADVIDVVTGLVAFSTELDSPTVGQFTAGDLLATNGVIIPNIALTWPFSVGYDVGLDGLFFVGSPEGIVAFLQEARDLPRDFWLRNPDDLAEMLRQYEIDLWFSTEGTSPTPMSPGFLDGDLLSAATGAIVASNGNLLPGSVPSGIPDRGVDFGLDAVAGDREGIPELIAFSTEILFEGDPTFTDGDVLLYGNGVVRANWDLIAPFEPKARFLGLDALSMVTRKPDLIVTKIMCDRDNMSIGYEIENAGWDVAPEGHFTQLLIERPGGVYTFHDQVTVNLNPGATHQGWFSIPDELWPLCGILEVLVCADTHDLPGSDNLVDEINEYNNCKAGGCLSAELEWTWNSTTAEPDYDQVMMAPVAADLNSDGIADVIFSTFKGSNYQGDGILRAISGADGSELFSVTDPAYRVHAGAEPAVADIDNDERPEIMVSKDGGEIICFEHDGSSKWETANTGLGRLAIAVADLDRDGTPEIIAGKTVFNNDGTVRWTGTGSSSLASAVADLNLDGWHEVVANSTAYTGIGTIHWGPSAHAGRPAIGNFDEDLFPEIVSVGGDQVSLTEHDGTLKWGPVAMPGGGGNGPPVVADIDGDGEPEIGVGGRDYYVAFETDGSIKWMADIRDYSSRAASSSAFDFDQDGRAEIVYSDELRHRIFRGTDGAVLFEVPGPSGTVIEQPIILDVDNDGHVEIVFAVNNYAFPGNTGIEVYGNDSCWPGAREIWNQHTYHITNIGDDAAVPIVETNNWEVFNNYRTQATTAPVTLGDLDCNGRFDGTDVLIQATLVVDLISCEEDLIMLPCINVCPDDVLARSDWDCLGSIDGTDVLIGASIIVDIITEADTPLGQGCP
jgi:hypothetical protein